MRNATLRQLKVFETAARHLSFSRAAEELHLTQPAVSAQIRELEGHAGLPLFEQLGRRLVSDRGGPGAPPPEPRDPRAVPRGRGGHGAAEGHRRRARFRSPSSARATTSFHALLAAFAARHPGVKLDLDSAQPRGAAALPRREPRPISPSWSGRPRDDDVLAVPFAPHAYVDRRVTGAPAGRPTPRFRWPASLARAVRRSRARLGHRERDARGVRRRLRESCKVAMEIASNETIKQAVIAGLGLSFLSVARDRARARARPPGRARRRRLSGDEATGTSSTGERSACRRWPPRSARSCWTRGAADRSACQHQRSTVGRVIARRPPARSRAPERPLTRRGISHTLLETPIRVARHPKRWLALGEHCECVTSVDPVTPCCRRQPARVTRSLPRPRAREVRFVERPDRAHPSTHSSRALKKVAIRLTRAGVGRGGSPDPRSSPSEKTMLDEARKPAAKATTTADDTLKIAGGGAIDRPGTGNRRLCSSSSRRSS